jgi:uncharacterized membrane protein
MNRMLVAVFDSEPVAYQGLNALKRLHDNGDISLYASAVLARDPSGAIVKQSADPGPAGTALGMLMGSFVGLLGGPAGTVAGASLGAMSGAIADLSYTGVNLDFIDDVSKAMTPGKVAILADIDEAWTTPVDTAIGQLGGKVFRRARSEVVEDQLVRASNEFKAELSELKDELRQASGENKAAVQREIDRLTQQLETTRTQEQKRISQVRTDADARLASLRDQMNRADADRKARIEKRIATVKADLDSRNTKLKQAERSVTEALAG